MGLRGQIIHELFEQLTGEHAGDGALRTLLDALPDAIVVVDRAGTIVFSGGSIETLSGHAAESLVGQPIEVLVPWARREQHARDRAAFAAAPAARGMGAAGDIHLVHADGRELPVDVSLSPVEFDGHRFVVAAVRDASDRHRAEQALQRALDLEVAATRRLRELDASKDTFLRAVSHDMRTPLAVVQGLAETLARRADQLGPEDTARLAGRLEHNAKRLSRLLTDLLDVDRLSRGVVQAQRRPTEAVALVRGAIERCVPAERVVHLDAPETLQCTIDPAQVERVVDNLLVNAVRHTPTSGDITVRLTPDATTEPPGLRLVVEDEGPGVQPEDRQRIFEPFTQLSNQPDATAQAPGSGIGLSLVAEFARLHGGAACVTDAPSGGASFQVWLPGADQLRPATAVEAAADGVDTTA